MDGSSDAYVQNYNSLLSVESAYEQLLQSDFDGVSRRIYDIAAANGLEDELGLFLIHRHISLQPDEVMVESVRSFTDGRVGYVTNPKALTEGVAVSSWYWADGAKLPFEYVDGNLAAEANILNEAAVWDEIGEVIQEAGLGGILGAGFVSRPPISGEANPETLPIFVEEIDPIERIQGVFEKAGDEKRNGLDDLIPTRWRLRVIQDFTTQAVRYCEPMVLCVPRAPGHESRTAGHVPTGE